MNEARSSDEISFGYLSAVVCNFRTFVGHSFHRFGQNFACSFVLGSQSRNGY